MTFYDRHDNLHARFKTLYLLRNLRQFPSAASALVQKRGILKENMNRLFPAGGVDIQFTPPVEFTGRKQ